ncbi:aspartate kinase [Candidatus Dependentiae bacterium]|nr:aspartate kinase [Candidatus Dependentiae bacterium]
MGLVIQKYGGTSVESLEKIVNVAEKVIEKKESGNDIVVVISAMGNETDRLLSYAYKFTKQPNSRELDMLISTGEQQAGALLSIVLNSKGVDTISLTGHQIGIITDNNFKNAKILKINELKLREHLNKGRVVVVAGFQGVNQFEEITTLGRGGSDTTAVALGAILKADICEIYTDVEGIYSLDPELDSESPKFKTLTYDELLEITFSGAKVVHPRAAELAKKFNIPLIIKSSFTSDTGTIIVKDADGLDREEIYAITLHKKEVRVIFDDIKFKNSFSEFLNDLRKHGIIIENITYEVLGERPHVTIILENIIWEKLKEKLESNELDISFSKYIEEVDISTLTIHGIGISIEKEIFNEVLNILRSKQVNILSINKESKKLEIIISSGNSEEIVKLINRKLNIKDGPKN